MMLLGRIVGTVMLTLAGVLLCVLVIIGPSSAAYDRSAWSHWAPGPVSAVSLAILAGFAT